MVIPEDRQMAIELIDEAISTGAHRHKGCEVIEIDTRTLRRWKEQQRKEVELRDRRKESAAITDCSHAGLSGRVHWIRIDLLSCVERR